MKQMTRYILMMFLMLTVSHTVSAQFGFDMLSLEAGIDDHKRIRSIVYARATMEQANEQLHQYSKDAVLDNEDINKQLDRYTHMFDVIDVIYSSASLVFNIKNTYDDAKEKIEGTKKLLERYKERVIMKDYRNLMDAKAKMQGLGNISGWGDAKDWYNDAMDWYNNTNGGISAQDTIILNIGSKVITLVKEDVETLISSFKNLGIYLVAVASGASSCSTAALMEMLNEINGTLDHMRAVIDQGYYALWKYIHVRTGYWTQVITPRHTIREICERAYARWQRAQNGPNGIGIEQKD